MLCATHLMRGAVLSSTCALLLGMTPMAQAHDHGRYGYQGGYGGYGGYHGYHGYRDRDRGRDIVGGLLAGAVIGGLIYAGTHDGPVYAPPPTVTYYPGYYAPPRRVIYTQPPVTYYPTYPSYGPPIVVYRRDRW